MDFAACAFLRFRGAFLEVVIILRRPYLRLILERGLVGTKSCSFCWEDCLLEDLLRISLSTRGVSFVDRLGGALGVYFDNEDVFSWDRSIYKVAREVVDSARWIHLPHPSPCFVSLTQGTLFLFVCFLGLGNTPHPNRFGIYAPSSLAFFVVFFWARWISKPFVRTILDGPASSRSRTLRIVS